MADNPSSSNSISPHGSWSPDLIFDVLADAGRRQLLVALAKGGGQPASALCGATRRRLDATLKQLTALRESGLLVTGPDPADGRRQLYWLAPGVPVSRTPDGGVVLDFGFVAVRW
jgi:hypothetical protein